MRNLTYIETLKLAVAIKETSNHVEQTVGILAITDRGDKQAIVDGRLEKLVEFGRYLRTLDGV
jgi:hypothetical protein